ncbi:MAG: 1-deoxy-D-xylulose-5-phosphate reductoisomerase [Firmicutes bacterium HGW-Firmicutes-1]|jgi:1-deoxy-D-xylulose-5-phosphate reductoisomerase|nr:MAG: 1-deoxy-D-xylulose-5-phosphate reductoisomerase [Firmicutes bacterium HGW-Firmicutes-1]
MKKISILGSTGSIGMQTLEIVDENEDIQVYGLTTNTNIERLYQQIQKFKPKVVAVMDEKKAMMLKSMVHSEVTVLQGIEGLIEVATLSEIDTVVTAVVGMIGLRPTIEAIKASKNIALANKETLVTAGSIIMELAKKHNVSILPVDSEHSAIFQALKGENAKEIENIWLTASGGPFRGLKTKELEGITLEQALKHPNWSMGHKITIDSATLMNKGLEVIEAKWLFDVSADQIKVVVHPQSIIHSMVEFCDGSVIGQLGLPDMKLPIQYALYYPNRHQNSFKRLNLAQIGKLTFEEPDRVTFPCLQLAFDAMNIGGSMPTVLNAANELVVSKFLNKEIGFIEIPKIIDFCMSKHDIINEITLDKILEVQKWTYELIESRW